MARVPVPSPPGSSSHGEGGKRSYRRRRPGGQRAEDRRWPQAAARAEVPVTATQEGLGVVPGKAVGAQGWTAEELGDREHRCHTSVPVTWQGCGLDV